MLHDVSLFRPQDVSAAKVLPSQHDWSQWKRQPPICNWGAWATRWLSRCWVSCIWSFHVIPLSRWTHIKGQRPRAPCLYWFLRQAYLKTVRWITFITAKHHIYIISYDRLQLRNLRQSTCQVPPWWQGLSPGWVWKIIVMEHTWPKLAEITPKQSPSHPSLHLFSMMRLSLPHLASSVGLFCVPLLYCISNTRHLLYQKPSE